MESLEFDLNNNNINLGLLARKNYIKNGKVELMTRLYCDIFNSDRYLLDNVNIKIVLTRNKPEFYIKHKRGMQKVNVVIQQAILLIRRVKISPQITLAHTNALSISTAKYPIKRTIISHYTIDGALKDYQSPCLTTNVLPQRIVVGMVDHSAFNGDHTLNPFNFQHFNLLKIELALENGNVVYPNGLELDFESDKYLRAYYTLFEGIDKPVFMTGNDISRKEYPQGYTLFCFDLTSDLCSGDHLNIKQTEKPILKLRFRKTR